MIILTIVEDLLNYIEEELNKREWLHMNEKRHKPSPGPTPLYGEPMKRIITLMPRHMIDWIDSNPGTRADVIRGIIQKAMDEDKKG